MFARFAPDDTDRLRAFHRQLSPESISFRFFRYMPELSQEDAERFTHVDYERRMALVATTGSGEAEEILGVVRYEDIRPQTAEVAFVVEDHWQGHGIATALLHCLADYARRRGYTTFVAITMGTNMRKFGNHALLFDTQRNCINLALVIFVDVNGEHILFLVGVDCLRIDMTW